MYTIFTKTPVVKWVIHHSSIFRLDAIQAQLNTEEKRNTYEKILKSSTLYLSFCFFFSSLLNFFLALRIFQDSTGEAQQQQILNEQISDMIWVSFLVIGLPLTIVTGVILWILVHQLKSLTSLTFEEMLHVDKS